MYGLNMRSLANLQFEFLDVLCKLMYDSKQLEKGIYQISHFPTSSGTKERKSERCEQMTERTSEWPSTYAPITGSSKPPCNGARNVKAKNKTNRLTNLRSS